MKVPITKPYFDDDDKRAVAEPLDTGWVTQGPRTAEFEKAFARAAGVKYASACTSCTTGLHLALLALGVKPGDEVIVPSFTFIASANAVEYVGATPVFCDVDLSTFNIDAEDAGRKITPRTRALMPVHLFGLGADMDAVNEAAKKHGLRVLEDAACAVGATYRGKWVGGLGDAGVFSFHPRKVLVTGEGGMVTTSDEKLHEKINVLRNHAATVSDLQRHESGGFLLPDYEAVGFNYRMTDMQGALGLTQLKKLEDMIARRVARARRYDALLGGVKWLKIPRVPPDCRHTYQSYVTLIDAGVDVKFRNRLMKTLEDKGVATRQGTHAVHLQKFYRAKYKLAETDFPNSLAADRRSLSLPLYYSMTDTEQEYVVETLLASAAALL